MKYFIVMIFIISSCAFGPGGDGSAVSSTIGEELVNVSDYGPVDRDIATRICYAFQSKRSNFLSNQSGAPFRFDLLVENLGCKIGKISKIAETNLVATSLIAPMYFDSLVSRDEFEPYLQTNAYGYLIEICDLVMRGESMPEATKELGNYKRTQIRFFDTGEDIGFIFKSYESDWSTPDSVFTLQEYDYLSILVDPSNEMYGIVLERRREEQCENDLVERKSQLYLP